MQITVNASETTGALAPFWASTGFTPATLLLTDDMRQQLIHLGAIPRQGVQYVRIHFLLELVDVTFEDGATARCDWSRLEQGLDLLVQNQLLPIFELMGNPNGQFDDFNDPVQLERWRVLVRDLAQHLEERYGREEVRCWYFEAWNEPDAGWWHQWPWDTGSFCNYYDACAAGLADADPALTLGGPGSCRTLSGLFMDFVAHCDTGTNRLTGGPVRLDFISIHEKGVRSHKEDLNPRTEAMIAREAQIVDYLRQYHPRLAKLPFMNNECDPQVGWRDFHTWHGRPYYAAWVVKSVDLHLRRLVDDLGVNYALLGNDNGFIGGWGNRTLLTRFGPADWIEDGQSGHVMKKDWARRDFATPPFTLLKKPVFSAMTLLSLLGEERLAARCAGELADPAEDAALGVIATRRQDAGQVAVMIYYARDRIISEGEEPVRLCLEGLPFQQAVLRHYRIDEAHGDPYTLWEAAGAPEYPDEELLAAMRAAQEPVLYEAARPVDLAEGRLELNFDLPLHAVSLVLLSARPAQAPSTVTGLRAEAFPGLRQQGETLLRWQPLPARSLLTYRLARASTPDGPFAPLDQPHLLCAAYMVSQPGFYRVTAVDDWGQEGPPSDVVAVSA